MAATATLSSGVSFSHDLDLSSPSPTLPYNGDNDFDFSVSLELEAPSPADELFSNGKLLPLSSSPINNTSHPIKPPPTLPKARVTDAKYQALSASSCNNIGRSSSVGTGSRPTLTSIFSFPRSKSTGSFPTQKMRSHPKKSQSQNQSQNARSWYSFYYSSGSKRSSTNGNRVAINPIINVPAPLFSRGGSGSSGSGVGGGSNSFIAYLLCNCRGKNIKELENFSP